jgi:hypothetical protein
VKDNIRDREMGKFRPARDGLSKTAVEIENQSGSPVIVSSNVAWDEVQITLPSQSQELFTYKKDSEAVMTVLVTYSDSSRKNILSINKQVF